MKKKTRFFLIGLIVLWAAGFLIIWGSTLIKKMREKKIPALAVDAGNEIKSPEQAIDVVAPGVPGVQQAAAEAVSVRGYKVGLRDFKDELPVMGTVKGALEIELKFEVNGVIEDIKYKEGDVIYKGDLLAVLKKKDAQLKVEYSKSKLESAKTQALAAQKKLEIHRNLYEIGGIIKAKLEEVELEAKSAEQQVVSAEVELRSAESELDKTNLYAPRDGVLGSKDVEVGEFVTPNDKVAVLYDTMKVFVEMGIVEKDIDKIALGQDVKVTVDAYADMEFSGIVDNVYPVIEGKSRTLTLRVGVENPDALLLPGMFARALITVAEFQNAIVIPSISLNKTDEGYNVFVAGENNMVSSRPVDVAYVTTDYTVINTGLYEGDIVITDTPQELKEGIPVNLIEIQENVQEEEVTD